MIKVVGLGYGDLDELTLGVVKILKESKKVFVENLNYSIISQLKKEGITFEKINYNFDKNEELVLGVLGSPLENRELINVLEEKKIDYMVYESVGIRNFIQKCMGNNVDKVDLINSKIIDETKINRRNELAIINLIDKESVDKVKSKLLNVYDGNIEVVHLKAGEYKKEGIYKLKDIQDIKDIDEESILYIVKNSKGKKNIYDLSEVIEILRGENGCPWDKEQTHKSIKKDIVEESYEVLDAIDKNDVNGLIEELGDVLFQVLFHASIAMESKEFTLLDITDGITNKMIYRHPHVFGSVNVNNTEEVLINWDELKKGEKNFKSTTDELNGVAKVLPALIRAKKIQKKAKKVGFDWDDVSGAFEKVKEELEEVMDVYKSEKMVRIRDEVGDLLFSCVNVSRFLKVDPEEALNSTTDKFIRRFSYMEAKAKEMNKKLEEMSLNDMDKLWDESKMFEKE